MAIQATDVPPGLIRCPYSATIQAYIAALQDVNPRTFESVSELWERVRSRGAEEGHVSFFADSDTTCSITIRPREERDFATDPGHVTDHPRVAFSFVFRFGSEDRAVEAWEADIFRQSRMRDQSTLDVTEGQTTGLGPNSMSSVTQGAANLTRQAIWQVGRYNISFGSTALDLGQSQVITTAIDARART